MDTLEVQEVNAIQLEGDGSVVGRALVLHDDKKGKPGKALACGAPVVSTDCPSGPAEILEGGRLGPLVSVGDAAALADAIARALDAPGDPAARCTRARDFSVERVAPRYLEALLPAATLDTSAASRSATAG